MIAPGDLPTAESIEDLVRAHAARVLAALLRRYPAFDACEDAVQEALVSAIRTWPRDGTPKDSGAWLYAAASRRYIDQIRADSARRDREQRDAVIGAPVADLELLAASGPEQDDTLQLLLMCCHPALTAPSQIALTLRAVGGLTTSEIAHAFLVPESTMAQRISRAKKTIADAGGRFAPLEQHDVEARLAVVEHVLYLIFNEGYAASSGDRLTRVELTNEAIRLTRQLRRERPDDDEIAGLLALMLLTDARRLARTTHDGALIALSDQDRTLWDQSLIREGVALVEQALAHGPLGPYQLQAAIAAVHDEATTVDDTDWLQILGLYDLLVVIDSSPIMSLNRCVAVAHVLGPGTALADLDRLSNDERLSTHHLYQAVRGHVLELAGDIEAARVAYTTAARRTRSTRERDALLRRARTLTTDVSR